MPSQFMQPCQLWVVILLLNGVIIIYIMDGGGGGEWSLPQTKIIFDFQYLYQLFRNSFLLTYFMRFSGKQNLNPSKCIYNTFTIHMI